MRFEKIVLERYVYLKLGKLYKHHPHKPFFLVGRLLSPLIYHYYFSLFSLYDHAKKKQS